MGGNGEDRRSGYAEASRSLGLGVTWMLSTIGFALLGRWLDGRLATAPVLTLLGALLGAGAGFWHLYHHAVVVPRERARRRSEKGDP